MGHSLEFKWSVMYGGSSPIRVSNFFLRSAQLGEHPRLQNDIRKKPDKAKVSLSDADEDHVLARTGTSDPC